MPGIHTFYDGSTILQPLADKIGIEVDKINFVICVFSSLPLAYVFKEHFAAGKVSRQTRALYPLLVGLTFMFFCFGRAVKHLLANALISYFIMYFSPSMHVHRAVFVFSMSYLMWIHFYRWIILTSYYIDITGPMMVSVQKITTLAFNLHDGKAGNEKKFTEQQKKESITEIPSLLDYMSYIFNFQTALTGPINMYADYTAYIDGTHVKPNKDGKLPCSFSISIRKALESLVYLVIFVIFSHSMSPDHLPTDEWLSLSFATWCFYWYLSLVIVRCSYYFAWTLADAVCNMGGFGFSGYDANGEATWELCNNVKPMQVEMAQSFKETLDGWNTQTGGWFRRIAYDRAPKSVRTVATYLLSAVWHGVSVGYYMTFATAALFTLSAATFRRCMRWRFVDNPNHKMAYDIFSSIVTKIALAYAAYPFVTMNMQPALGIWMRIFFIGHIVALCVYFGLPQLAVSKRSGLSERTGFTTTRSEMRTEKTDGSSINAAVPKTDKKEL